MPKRGCACRFAASKANHAGCQRSCSKYVFTTCPATSVMKRSRRSWSGSRQTAVTGAPGFATPVVGINGNHDGCHASFAKYVLTTWPAVSLMNKSRCPRLRHTAVTGARTTVFPLSGRTANHGRHPSASNPVLFTAPSTATNRSRRVGPSTRLPACSIGRRRAVTGVPGGAAGVFGTACHPSVFQSSGAAPVVCHHAVTMPPAAAVVNRLRRVRSCHTADTGAVFASCIFAATGFAEATGNHPRHPGAHAANSGGVPRGLPNDVLTTSPECNVAAKRSRWFGLRQAALTSRIGGMTTARPVSTGVAASRNP